MTDTYKCFGCDNEYNYGDIGGILEDGSPLGSSWFICRRCWDKLMMRKGSL